MEKAIGDGSVDTIILVFAAIIVMLSLYFLERMRNRINLGRYVAESAKRSAFSPTEFLIYDKSTRDQCDRLIIVQPFDWQIWAIGGQLYILNPEGSIVCSVGSTPAVKVLRDQFIEVCLKIEYDSLLRGYTEGVMPSKVVPYEIEGTTFTVLSALNLLVREYVTLADADTPMLAHRINAIDDADDDAPNGHRHPRSITAESVERMLTRPIAHAKLLEMYRMHVPIARKDRNPNEHDDDDELAATG